MTSTPLQQPPLRMRVQLPTRESFLANGVHQLELILQYGDLEEHVLMIDIHGHLLGFPAGHTQDDQVVGVSDNFVTINSLPPTPNNGEEGSGGQSSGNGPLPPSPRKKITGRRKTLFSKTCQICHKKFSNKYYAARHSFVHLNPEEKQAIKRGWKNKCYFCSKRFMTPSILSIHLLVHTKEKPHPCDKCHMKFNQQSSLSRHQRFHDSHPPTRRSFYCEDCGKSFTTDQNLTIHHRLHDSDPARQRPFHCEECGKSFTQQHSLTTHVKMVHLGLKEFQCLECDQKFSTKQNMLKHLNGVHYGIRYPCREFNCGKTYAFKETLRQHEKQVHGKVL